jgi:hypothetical protein
MARVNHRSGSYPSQVEPNTRTSPWPAVLPHVRGMQPPPADKRKLAKECTRLAWSIHCLQNVRARSVLILERQTSKLIQLRRQHDEYACALQDADPVLFAEVEQQRREWDDPIAALKWAEKGSTDDAV